jgi:hypothetical protein
MRSRWRRRIGAAGLATACQLSFRKEPEGGGQPKIAVLGGTNHVWCFGGYENAATVQGAYAA